MAGRSIKGQIQSEQSSERVGVTGFLKFGNSMAMSNIEDNDW